MPPEHGVKWVTAAHQLVCPHVDFSGCRDRASQKNNNSKHPANNTVTYEMLSSSNTSESLMTSIHRSIPTSYRLHGIPPLPPPRIPLARQGKTPQGSAHHGTNLDDHHPHLNPPAPFRTDRRNSLHPSQSLSLGGSVWCGLPLSPKDREWHVYPRYQTRRLAIKRRRLNWVDRQQVAIARSRRGTCIGR